MRHRFIISAAVLLLAPASASATTRLVPTQYPTIQAAIDDSNDSDEVVVAPGTYTGEGNRDIDFGGRAITVRSENGPDTCIIDCQGISTGQHRGFYFHSGEDANSVLDGFTIKNGYVNAYKDGGAAIKCVESSPTIRNCVFTVNNVYDPTRVGGYGGAIYNIKSSPALSNCEFHDNYANKMGGGICNHKQSSPIIENCQFELNTANNRGGAIYNWNNSNPTISHSKFVGNTATVSGGGVYSEYRVNATIANCIFSDNTAGNTGNAGGGLANSSCQVNVKNCYFFDNTARYGRGGAASNYLSTVTYANCVFQGNTAKEMSGAIHNNGSHNVKVYNCSFSTNAAPKGAGIGCARGYFTENPSNVDIRNSILWDDIPEISNLDGSTILISYSDIYGGSAGAGNLNCDPLFSDPIFLSLQVDSPCIDAGDPHYIAEPGDTDLDGRPRIIGGRIDMGAYEFNHIPIADAGADQTVYAWFDGIAKVILDGTGSYDDDSHPLTYLWGWTVKGNNFTAAGPRPIVELPVGECIIELIVNDGIDDSDPDWVIITVVPPMEASMKLTPHALNLSSHGNWVKAHFVLPEGFVVEDVDANAPAVVEPGQIESDYINVFLNNDGLVEIEATFDRAEFCSIVTGGESMEVRVVGSLTSGQQFYGTAAIKVIDKS
ncbi:MAG: right-handed parallel beta-helix repeat-containing protein, partial [Planctomycetota bacterium]